MFLATTGKKSRHWLTRHDGQQYLLIFNRFCIKPQHLSGQNTFLILDGHATSDLQALASDVSGMRAGQQQQRACSFFYLARPTQWNGPSSNEKKRGIGECMCAIKHHLFKAASVYVTSTPSSPLFLFNDGIHYNYFSLLNCI